MIKKIQNHSSNFMILFSLQYCPILIPQQYGGSIFVS